MLNFVLCDDNNIILSKLSKMLESIFIKNNLFAEVGFISTKSDEIIEYLSNNKVDVLLLDIDLKSNMSGLEVADLIRKKNKSIYIIFTTGHLEYGLVAYKYKTFDYLSKPITLERLEETVLRLFEDISLMPKNFIKIDNKNTIINVDTIHYIKKDGMKLVFHTDSREYEIYSSFNKISNSLPENFVRCHKSYIANIHKITDLQTSNNTILFNSSSSKCFIGPKYKNKLMEVLNHDGNIKCSSDCTDYNK